MPDAFDSGRHVYDAWKRGAEHIVLWLGQFDPSLPLAKVHELLEHELLSQEFREAFERGWNAAIASSPPAHDQATSGVRS